MTRRIPLVLGAGGQVGTAFLDLLGTARPVTRTELDLAHAPQEEIIRFVIEANPASIINCAAFTAVDRAEEEEQLATRVNGESVGYMAAAAEELAIPFLTFSTDYVFDGSGTSPYVESHPTDPINAYGRSKRAGEQAALATRGHVLLIRTSWVLSATHHNFVTTMLSRARDGQTLRVVDDQVGCPTIADDLARASWAAVEAGATGLLHLTNQGEATWYELARTAVAMAGLDPSLVSPCPTKEYPTPARRPSYSVLGSEVLPSLGLDPMPPWRDSLDRVVTGSLALIGART